MPLMYVSTMLTWGDPTMSFCFLRALCHVRFMVFQSFLLASLRLPPVPRHPPGAGGMPLIARQGVPPAMPIPVGQGGEPQFEQARLVHQQIRREVDIRQEAQRLLLQTQLQQLVEKIIKDKPDILCEKIRHGTPVERLVALQVIGRRRLPLEKELIDVLRDPDRLIRQTAHDALVRVSRGTDFGPKIGVSKGGLDRAVKRWRNWLDVQERVLPLQLAENIARVTATTLRKDPALEPKFIAVRGGFELQTVSAETWEEFEKARNEENKSARDSLPEVGSNDKIAVLAQAIPTLSDERQAEAREALTVRMTRLKAGELRAGLQDDNIEVRCAAALACGRKIAKEHIPDLLQLLDDPEMDVVLSARVALTELTGEDFGPTREVDRQGRVEAAQAWHKWWKEHQAKR